MPPSLSNSTVGTVSSALSIWDLGFGIWDFESPSSSERALNQTKVNHVQERSQFRLQASQAEQVADTNSNSTCDSLDSQVTDIPQLPAPKSKIQNLKSEIADLRRELLELKQEKADLEILLEATTEHSDSVEAELHNTAIAALKQSEEMFRTIAEATPVPVLISRLKDGAVLYANSVASTTFGIPSEDVLSHSTVEFYHDPSDRQKLLNAVECDGCVESFELRCKRADGSLFWVAASLRRLTFNDEPAFLTALCDITQRKLEEEALKRQVREMQIEIDQAKLARQVSEIVQSDYFQQLQAEVERLRYPEEDC